MIETTSPDWGPNFDDEKAQALIGKRVLVDVTYRSRSEKVLEQKQFYGEIISISRFDGIIVRLQGLQEERRLPPDLSRLQPAQPGQYPLKGSDAVVVDPDLVSSWTVYPPE